MSEIRELFLELVSGPGIEGELGVLERKLVQRMAEIARILRGFPEEKTQIFPDILWKAAGAIQDTLRATLELGEQPREQGMVFLGFVFATFNAIEPEPIPENWGLAGFGLGCALDAFDDSHLEACSAAVQRTIANLEKLKKELRPIKEQRRVDLFLARARR